MRTLHIAVAAGVLAASIAGAAMAQDAAGAMAPGMSGTAATGSNQPGMAPSGPMAPDADNSATNSNATAPATVDHTTVTNGPVPDTPENRAKYGAPMSHAGKRTKPAGN